MNLQTDNGLDIRYQHSGDALQIALKGHLDTLSAPELMELFDRLCANASFARLVINLENLEYLSSAGLRVFLMMAKEIFDTTGFSEVVTIR